jgi:hypothetical protein
MNQKVRYKEYRIIFIFPYVHLYRSAVLLYDHSVKGKRNRHPLIFLYAAVIMGIQIGKASVLIKRLLLYIQSRGINMRSENVHSLAHGPLSDAEHGYGFIHAHAVHLISLFQAFALPDQGVQITVSLLLCRIDNGVHAFPLCLALIQEIPVLTGKLIQSL